MSRLRPALSESLRKRNAHLSDEELVVLRRELYEVGYVLDTLEDMGLHGAGEVEEHRRAVGQRIPVASVQLCRKCLHQKLVRNCRVAERKLQCAVALDSAQHVLRSRTVE